MIGVLSVVEAVTGEDEWVELDFEPEAEAEAELSEW